MKKFNLSLNKQLFKVLILVLITLSTACKKGSHPHPEPEENYTVYFGTQDGSFYALNGKDGSQIWKYESTGDFSKSTPSIENSVIYTTNADSNLYALDAKTGALKWKFATAAKVMSSPAIANGVIYFGSRDHNMYAVDAATGTLKWKFRTEYKLDSAPTVSNGVVYIGSASGILFAFDATAGTKKWQYATGGAINQAKPAVSNGVVFIGDRRGIVSAVDANTGQLKWMFDTKDNISLEHSVITIHNGVLYFGSWIEWDTITKPGSLYAVKESDGTLIWKTLEGQGFRPGPYYADGKLYANGSDLFAVDAATGTKIWGTDGIFTNDGIPTAAFGKVFIATYVGGGDVYFNAFNAATGVVVWQFPLATKYTETSTALVVAEDGTAY